MEQAERQALIDQEHLKLLPLYFWVSGGFLGVYSLFMAVYFGFFGVVFLTMPPEQGASGPPAAVGWLFAGMGLLVFLFMAAIVVLKVMAGFWVMKRKNRAGIMIAAALSCLEFPYGTAAGVLTLVVLARPSVVALFGSGPPPIQRWEA